MLITQSEDGKVEFANHIIKQILDSKSDIYSEE